MSLSRRRFLGQAGAGLLTFTVAGCERELTPAEARRRQLPLAVLSPVEAAAVASLCEALVPGSEQAGIIHYLDHQLAAKADQCMLMIKYLGVPAPYIGFYRGGLAAAEEASEALYSSSIAGLDAAQAAQLVGRIATGEPDGWVGPPAGFFYFVLRSDAVDVVYGTPQGFESLGVPFNPHIAPPSRWGE